MRTLAVLLGLSLALVGCGTPMTAPLNHSSARSVDARTAAGLKAALRVYVSALAKRLDTNNDNKLSFGEVEGIFSHDQFMRFNTNGNAFVTIDEILADEDFVKAAIARARENASTVFSQLDANANQQLTWTEYQAALDPAATAGEQKYARLAFTLADTNHNGYLTLGEFEDMLAFAKAQAAGAGPVFADAAREAQAAAQSFEGAIAMAATATGIAANGQFVNEQGEYAFVYWVPLKTKPGQFYELTIKVHPVYGTTTKRNVKTQHAPAQAPTPLAVNRLMSPIQAIAAAQRAGLSVPPEGKVHYTVQFLSAGDGATDRIGVEAFKDGATLGSLTIDARTGAPISGVGTKSRRRR